MDKRLGTDNILKLLRFVGKYDLREDLFWGEELEFEINCSDVFHWGCSSFEEIDDDTLDEYFKAIEDVEALIKGSGWEFGSVLYAARRRKMRPQGAWFSADAEEQVKERIYPLLRECGPSRELGLANPRNEETLRRRGKRSLWDRIRHFIARL